MKKIALCLGLTTLFMLSSCKPKEEDTTTETTIENNTVQKDTVVVKDTKTVTPEPEGTSVKIDTNGVDIKSKNTKVEVKK